MKNSLFHRRNFLKGFLTTITCAAFSKNHVWGNSNKSNQTFYTDILSKCILNQGNFIPPIPKSSLDLRSSPSALEKKLNSKIKSQTGNLTNPHVEIEKRILMAISDDFLEGNIINVDRWYISETEYYALSYLSRIS